MEDDVSGEEPPPNVKLALFCFCFCFEYPLSWYCFGNRHMNNRCLKVLTGVLLLNEIDVNRNSQRARVTYS